MLSVKCNGKPHIIRFSPVASFLTSEKKKKKNHFVSGLMMDNTHKNP